MPSATPAGVPSITADNPQLHFSLWCLYLFSTYVSSVCYRVAGAVPGARAFLVRKHGPCPTEPTSA